MPDITVTETGPTVSIDDSGAPVVTVSALGTPGAQGPPGTTGSAGAAGSPGAAGVPGALWYTGSAVPSNALGANGDFYLRSNGDVYTKAAGSWGSPTASLLGPAGPGGGGALRGAWNVGTSYVANDVVVLNERAYEAVQAGAGHDPLPATQLFAGPPGTIDANDGSAYEMGVKIQPTGDVRLTAVAFYKATANTGTHVGRVWQLGANSEYYLVNQATFTGETASGWQTVPLSADLAAGNTYIVSCAFPAGHYSFDSGYFNAPVTVGSITAPVGAGMYSTTVGHVPDHVGGNANYWITPVWGEPNADWWQQLGTWQILPDFPSAQESAAAYLLSQIGVEGGVAGLDGFGHLASTASGVATIPAGSTSVAVAHGLPRVPTLQQVSAVATNSLGSATRFWCSAVDGTNVTFNTDSAPGGSGASIAWQIGNV